jgi:uncharacterized protein
MSTRFLRSRTTLGVRDVAASVDFYERSIGFGVFVTMGDPPDFALIGTDNASLGLVQTDDPAVASFAGCYFDVEQVEALYGRCVAAGATIINPLTRQPWGNYDFVIADPDGHWLAFGEVPAQPAP